MIKRYQIGRDRGLGVFMEETDSESLENVYVEARDFIAMEERLAALEVMIDAAKTAGCVFVQKAPYTENCVECILPCSVQ